MQSQKLPLLVRLSREQLHRAAVILICMHMFAGVAASQLRRRYNTVGFKGSRF